MPTPQWIKKLGGVAGELYVAAELSRRGILNALLPENFSDDDIMACGKDGNSLCFIQVKACHPDRSSSFLLHKKNEAWKHADPNKFVVFVWLGSPSRNESPKFWIARRSKVGIACEKHPAHGTSNWERRFSQQDLPAEWKDNWAEIERFIAPHNPALQPTPLTRRG